MAGTESGLNRTQSNGITLWDVIGPPEHLQAAVEGVVKGAPPISDATRTQLVALIRA